MRMLREEVYAESRMRENRTYGLMRGKGDTTHGMRLFSPERGNPETEVCRNLNSVSSFSTLP